MLDMNKHNENMIEHLVQMNKDIMALYDELKKAYIEVYNELMEKRDLVDEYVEKYNEALDDNDALCDIIEEQKAKLNKLSNKI